MFWIVFLVLSCLHVSVDSTAYSTNETCPGIFTDNKRGFGALFHSVLSRKIHGPCHTCIHEKTKKLGMKVAGSDAQGNEPEWSCLELLVAASKDGCADICLNSAINQCIFVHNVNKTNADSIEPTQIAFSPLCSNCLTSKVGTCTAGSDCQTNCALKCPIECQFPVYCKPPSKTDASQTASTYCQRCLQKLSSKKKYKSDFWLKRECLVDKSNEGCRNECVKQCGNGQIGGSEQCDDGNLNDKDGCNKECNIEMGYTCSHDKSNKIPSNCSAICGDGLLLGNEQCDDGNNVDYDGCSKGCKIEKLHTCRKRNVTTDGVGPTSICYASQGYTCNKENGVCTAVCGDGLVKGNEGCDDGNLHDNDGCSKSCKVEQGYACNMTTNTSTCNPICGNNRLEPTEICDWSAPGAKGCTQDCKAKSGYLCQYEGREATDTCRSVCGDGILVDGEECDDSNLLKGDGCSNTCTIERGYNCSKTSPSKCSAICGDNLVMGKEKCDNGNKLNGDGCSSVCTVEAGYTCSLSGGSSSCNPVCGDGLFIKPEQCDDKNLVNNDGCSKTCTVENGYTCSNDTPSVCSAVCGDGLVLGNEQCDDGNVLDGDGCSSACKTEKNYKCSKQGGKNSCSPVCGDGVTIKPEECDDQNLRDGDGCSGLCKAEKGYTCSNESPSVCSIKCGDGITMGQESCDDGNNKNGDGCSSTCKIERGYVCPAVGDKTTCNPVCGDGLVRKPETCDDGNTIDRDGCSSSCQVEATCGNGVIEVGETCDDGNSIGNDGCSPLCVIEETGDNGRTQWLCPTRGRLCHKICLQRRVRKHWASYTEQEQDAYRRAVGIAMQRQLYAAFVGIHFEDINEQEAHQTCGFLGWHRKYLLAYENMLRSLGNDFVCVTLPYWDYFTEYARFSSQQCSTIGTCCPIANGLGGSNGRNGFMNMPGSGSQNGNCVGGGFLENLCPATIHSSGRGSCSRCVVRGGWNNIQLPAGTGYGTLAGYITNRAGNSYARANQNIQSGFHNNVHNSLGGAMQSLASPVDPIFFSHHCSIDLAWQLYYKCNVGRKMSINEKRTSPLAFESCGSTQSGSTPFANSEVTMEAFDPQRGRLVSAHDHPVLAPYFQDLPREYYHYIDSTDIDTRRNISYTYEVDDLMSALMRNGLVCENPRYVFLDDKKNSGILAKSKAGEEMLLKEPHSLLSATTTPEKRYYDWFQHISQEATKTCGSKSEVLEQVEYIECLNYDRKYGCSDYDEVFKLNFKINYKERCKQIVDDVRSGKKKVKVQNWENLCDSYFTRKKVYT